MADTRCVDLPQDCWKLIFKNLDELDLEAVSLVCKEFLSISDTVRHTFSKPYIPSIEVLSRFVKRFPLLKVIDLSRTFYGDIDIAILKIARSGLNLEALYVSYRNVAYQSRNIECRMLVSLKELGSHMNNLKSLECSYCSNLQDGDLGTIANSLPWLEEINISHWKKVTDKGIEVMTSKLRNLSKINISHNRNLTGRSLVSLSSNCVVLREIIARGIGGITQNFIAYFFRHTPNLVSLSVDKIKMNSNSSSLSSSGASPASSSLTIANSIAYAKALCVLEISSTEISDTILSSMAQAHLPLEKLALKGCYFIFHELSILLQACQYSLQELNLGDLNKITDEWMVYLSRYLHNITYINFSGCPQLTALTLVILIRNCPLLERIDMQSTRIGDEEDDFGNGSVKNDRIRSLCLSNNSNLNDKLLKKIGISCPNLKVLDVGFCPLITEEGIEEIFKSCKEIRNLSIGSHIERNFFGTEDFQLKLEALEVAGLKINEQRMATITKRCPELRYLYLNHGSKVTEGGRKKVVKNCRICNVKEGSSFPRIPIQ